MKALLRQCMKDRLRRHESGTTCRTRQSHIPRCAVHSGGWTLYV